MMIDTHAHIYVEDFDDDRAEVIQRAKEAGISQIILPNIDVQSLPRMVELERIYPDFCHAAIGLHPTSVDADFEVALQVMEAALSQRDFIAIGEIGIDLYWDKTYVKEQTTAFQKQLEWALTYNKPVIIHVRNSYKEVLEAMDPFKNSRLKGVFHSFTGSIEEAENMLSFGGFYLGINGIVTFKNAGLRDVIKHIDLNRLVLETDAPYLSPVPFRGKRNESAYLKYITPVLATVYELPVQTIIDQTTENALNLFNVQPK